MAVAIPAATEASTDVEKVSPSTVQKAVDALLKWKNSKSQTEKPKLFDLDDEFVYLILTLKKLPPKSRVNAHKIPLPHSLLSEFSENCLIVDDRPKSNLNKEDAQKKIKSENIPVSKVIKLSKLHSNYRPFESKRKLCGSYHMFFADKGVIPLLPRLLGKQFFKKKKIPVPVDLKHKNWKEQIDRACSSAFLFLRTGTCSVVKVAKVSMEMDEIIANVTAAINGIVELLPKGWGSVRSFHLKILDSLALPLYQVIPDMKLKIEGVKSKKEVNEEDGDVVKDEAKKDRKVVKKKGRIHEIRYMDDSVGHELSQDESGSEEGNEDDEMTTEPVVDKKKRKGSKTDKGILSEKKSKKASKNKDESKKDGDVEEEDNEDDGMTSEPVVDKKRKGSKADKEILSEKKLKKAAKNKNKSKNGDAEEEDNEDDRMTIEPVVDKKKRKGSKTDKEVLSEVNSEKKLKKATTTNKDKSKKDGLSSKRKKENDLHAMDEVSGKKKMESGEVKVKAKKIKKATTAE